MLLCLSMGLPRIEFRCPPLPNGQLRVTPVSDTMVIPSSRGEQLWCPQRSEVWDGEMETEGENCIKISDSNVYGGEHVAIPHPATSTSSSSNWEQD